MYNSEFTKQAQKDSKKVTRAGYRGKVDDILDVVERDPFEPTSGHYFEKLVGDLKDKYSRRINYHNRFVYEVLPNTEGLRDDETGELYEGIVNVLSMWGHPY